MVNKPANPFFRPQQQMLALEPRILFDGAAAVAAEHQNQDNQATPAEAPDHGAPTQTAQPRQLLVRLMPSRSSPTARPASSPSATAP